ncbi:MAG: hypothetical protein M3R13_00900 [Armatimonadota bacterium]|nr:hypothetical protein [Armatimonadota bacterium]
MIIALAIAHAIATRQELAPSLETDISPILAYALASETDPMDHALIDGANVHVFLPPVLVSKGRLLCVDWSEDGKFLLVASERSAIDPAWYKAA